MHVTPWSRLRPADSLVIGLFDKQSLTTHPWWPKLPTAVKKILQSGFRPPSSRVFQAVTMFHVVGGRWANVVLVGLGDRSKWNTRRDRLAARRMAGLAQEHRWRSMTIPMQRLNPEAGALMSENFVLANYAFRKFLKTPKDGWPELKQVHLCVNGPVPTGTTASIREGMAIAEATNEARDLANRPGGSMTPKVLAAEARAIAKEYGLQVKILDRAAMTKLGMGALLGVAQGSVQEPRLIVLEYKGLRASKSHASTTPTHPRGGGAARPLVIVGKGVTFDSGGINLKPSQSMSDMHMDMAGGAAAIGAIAAISQLKLPLDVVTIVPAVENMPSGSGYRPGDVLKPMSGPTIEVGDTDAEGRIILADALNYAQKFYQPQMIVDVATLTGAAVVALGQRAIAGFTNDPAQESMIREVGEASGDYAWPMPLWEEYEPEIKGTFGDVSNVGKTRWGGAIHGALFLKRFIKDKTPWIHLDIAPTMTPAEGDHLAKGATGSGVRFLVALARHLSVNK